MAFRSLAPWTREPPAAHGEPLWKELTSGRWAVRSRHEEDSGIVLVFSRRGRTSTPLTARQKQALELAARGQPLKHIAHEMSTSVSTASTHIASALERLGFSRADACLLLAACSSGDGPVAPRPGIEAVLAVRLDVDRLSLADALTRAEREVARAILRGHSNAKIAADRQRSLRTVANQVAVIFRKLGVSSRAELLAKCTLRREAS